MKLILPAAMWCALLASPLCAQRGVPPTHRDVMYGPHERNVMDVWLAKSDQPTPLLVSIHGGGFRAGRKTVDAGVLAKCLDSGISVAAITYRFSEDAIAPAAFYDSARAVQFIRHQAAEWNIDPRRIAATGSSAGAGISLWLGLHDDLQDPSAGDPVLRESSRLSCVAVYNAQTSYDPRFIRELIPENDTYKHPALAEFFAVDLNQLDELPAEKYRLFEEASPLPLATADDVPVLLVFGLEMETKITGQGIGIHHPRFGRALQEKLEAVGVECRVETGVRIGTEAYADLVFDFVREHLSRK